MRKFEIDLGIDKLRLHSCICGLLLFVRMSMQVLRLMDFGFLVYISFGIWNHGVRPYAL